MVRPTETRTIFRRLFDLAMPVVGLNVLGVLSLAVDTAMCGRLPNAEHALAALAFASQIVFLLMVAMMGLTVGTVAFVSRAYGGGDHSRVNHILHQSTLITYLVAIAVAIVGNVFAEQGLHALGASDDVIELGLQYLRPLLTCSIFYYMNLLFAAVLRGVGNTWLPFVVAIVSNGLNVFLNYGLILGNMGFPAMGVSGAAWGTVISQAVGVAVTVLWLRTDIVPGVRTRLQLAAIDHALARDLLRVGAPAALDMVILNVAFFKRRGHAWSTRSSRGRCARNRLRLQSLAFVPGLGISQATGAMVGAALGASKVNEARSRAIGRHPQHGDHDDHWARDFVWRGAYGARFRCDARHQPRRLLGALDQNPGAGMPLWACISRSSNAPEARARPTRVWLIDLSARCWFRFRWVTFWFGPWLGSVWDLGGFSHLVCCADVHRHRGLLTWPLGDDWTARLMEF
ncbi:MAG: MATE family efflux transporter [Polyangiales bacterium]